MNKLKAFWEVLTSEWSFAAFAVGAVGLQFQLGQLALWLNATLAIVALDAILFHDVLRQGDGAPRMAYRAFYEMIWWPVCAHFCVVAPWAGVAFFLARFTGVNDWLYYVFLKDDQFSTYNPAPWLGFTIWSRLGVEPAGKELAWYGPLSAAVLALTMLVHALCF